MRLSAKLIDEVIADVAGDDVVPLVRAMKNKKNISEFKLAENIEREVNETRNMLYRLHNANLVTFMRRKDKKKGWYIYYWTFNAKRIKHLVIKLKKERLEKLQDRLVREENNYFFSCEERCIRLDFEQATDFEFKCPECGSLIMQEDNSKIIDSVKKEMADIEIYLKENKSS